MSDARALLKAKRQETKITHPLASYNQAGQLKCSVCGTPVKHASIWEGHLGSKLHRTNVARLKQEEKAREEQRLEEERRKKEEEEEESLGHGKRKADDDDDELPGGGKKKLKITSGFPDDFFSDPARRPLMEFDEEEEKEAEPVQPSAQEPKSAVDLEYERFQQELLSQPDYQETYERATIIAEPEPASEVPEGFPANEEVPADETVGKKLTEDEARRLKEQDERELIMDRYIEEERAQEEADMRVAMMKTRLEGLRRKREAAKATATNKA